jgi:dimethylargininase
MNFSQAITRLPAETFSQGISTANLGVPDRLLTDRQHHRYVLALQKAGLTCLVLPTCPAYPDSVFVEDTAVLTRDFAVISRPGADARRGEAEEMSLVLSRRFAKAYRIQAPGTLDGGDICQVGKHFLIGLSQRTNLPGAEQLAGFLEERGYSSEVVDIRGLPGILHLKSAVNCLSEDTLLLDPRMAEQPTLRRYRKLLVRREDAYSANCLRVNDLVLVPSGFPRTRELLEKNGFETLSLEISEYQKMDGGLSCLSLRW